MTKDHLEIPADRDLNLKASELDSPRIENEEVRRSLKPTATHDPPIPPPETTENLPPPPNKYPKGTWVPPATPNDPIPDTTTSTVLRHRARAIVDGHVKSHGNDEKGGLKNSEGTENAEPPHAPEQSEAEAPKDEPQGTQKSAASDGEANSDQAEQSKESEDHSPLAESSDDAAVLNEIDDNDDTAEGAGAAEKEVADVDTDSAADDGASSHGDSSVGNASPPPQEESADLESRLKHMQALQMEDQKQKKAQDSLIKDAVTHGNRAKTPDAGDSGTKDPPSPPESALDVEIRELMQQAQRFRWGTKDIKPDYARAFGLCETAAAKGSLDGINCLGEFFKHGLGRERDIEKAVKHFKDAAQRGHAAAQRNLAFLYSSGHGVEQSTALAVLHLHFAAVAGDHQAQLSMGYRHMYGIGVPKNCQTAMEFYMPASEFVVKEMHNNRAQPMIEKQALSTEGNKGKNLDLDEDVVNYYAYSAERGDASAQVALGQLYFMGARGLQQDHGEAYRWYLRAAEQGDANAMGHLGNMYAQGIHVEANNQTALSYFRRGVEKGNALALNGLGFMHMYGMGVPQSYDEAFKSFSKAAEQGNQEARFNLGALHVGGYGVPKDYAKAIYYFTLAANRGHMLALYNLAMMHLNGFGTPPSCPNAVQFIKSVAERGEWAGQLQRGYKLYQGGDADRALLVYAELMELGFDVAQANVAHIFDEEASGFTRGQKAKALRAYELSAQQGNMAAELKIGDYYYHGWGTAVNYRKAVAHYRAASEARIAQAMFNLGWMHEQGNGIAQDRHLAKRFYDMAAEAAPEAVWPAGICLAKLWLVGAGEAALEAVDAAALALTLRFGKYGVRVPMSTVWIPWALQYWDAILGAVLLAMLSLVLAVRSQLAVARHTRHI